MSNGPITIRDDDDLDRASETLDSLRRKIARRVIECTRLGVAVETDDDLAALRNQAEEMLAAITAFEFRGCDASST